MARMYQRYAVEGMYHVIGYQLSQSELWCTNGDTAHDLRYTLTSTTFRAMCHFSDPHVLQLTCHFMAACTN